MITRIRGNKESFRPVEFSPSFNLVLAERTTESSERDSRNGLGKSLLIEILNFCLGARGTKGHGVVVEPLDGWVFRVDLRNAGSDLAFSRAVADDERRWIYVDSAFDNWPVKPAPFDGRARFKVPDQNKLLGRILFGLTESIEETKWSPTYRSLVSYVMRRGPDAYLEPFTHDRNQQEWDKQVNVSYHLNLNWRDAAGFQDLRAQKKVIDQLSRATQEGALPSYLGSEGALEAERVRLKNEIEQRVQRLATFQVREDYREIEEEASRLTEEAHELVNESIRDRRYIDLYSSRLEDEREAIIGGSEVERLFEEARVVFPDQVRRRLNDVKLFHDAVIENRQSYLAGEIERLEAAIAERTALVDQLDERKAELMTVIESAGALEEYTRLQELLVELRGRLHDVEARLARLKEVTDAKQQWQGTKTSLLARTRTRYDELRAERDRAIALFNANTEALYEAPGRLIIDVTERGLVFDIDIGRSDSHGVSNMKIFCFDLMLMQLWAERGGGPGFLVHDSTLFEGVDERQIAAALDLAYAQSERLSFQYICAMNSDDLPRKELGEENPVLSSVALELHDKDPSGRLLGIEF
jgi:uncharacterized protein YydD (DUF2326 family)